MYNNKLLQQLIELLKAENKGPQWLAQVLVNMWLWFDWTRWGWTGWDVGEIEFTQDCTHRI